MMNCRRHGSPFCYSLVLHTFSSGVFECLSVYLSPRAMRHAGSVRHRPVTPVGNKTVLATERSTEQRIREREEVCERAHTTCRPEHCSSIHARLSLRADAASLRLLYSRSCALAPQDRQAREKVDDWMARASSTPGNNYDKQQHAHNQAPAPVPLCFLSL